MKGALVFSELAGLVQIDGGDTQVCSQALK